MVSEINRMKEVIHYCNEIEDTIEEYGRDIEDFLENPRYRDLCSFYIS